MTRLSKVLGAIVLAGSALAVLTPAKAQLDFGWAGTNAAARGAGNSYDPSYCDYYDPPWGYPPNYCNYPVWYEPVYVDGSWYQGPIYYSVVGGENWYWLHGGWWHDEWRGGSRPPIDWNSGGNRLWYGRTHGGRDYPYGTWRASNDTSGGGFDENGRGARGARQRSGGSGPTYSFFDQGVGFGSPGYFGGDRSSFGGGGNGGVPGGFGGGFGGGRR